MSTKYLTLPEYAKKRGVDLSTVYRWKKQSRTTLTPIKLSGLNHYSLRDLDQVFRDAKVKGQRFTFRDFPESVKDLRWVGYEGYCVSAAGHVYDANTRRRLRQRTDPDGYRTVSMGQYDRQIVSRLVLLGYVGPPHRPDYEADHLDGNPANNRFNNLMWVTPEANKQKMLKRKLGKVRASDSWSHAQRRALQQAFVLGWSYSHFKKQRNDDMRISKATFYRHRRAFIGEEITLESIERSRLEEIGTRILQGAGLDPLPPSLNVSPAEYLCIFTHLFDEGWIQYRWCRMIENSDYRLATYGMVEQDRHRVPLSADIPAAMFQRRRPSYVPWPNQYREEYLETLSIDEECAYYDRNPYQTYVSVMLGGSKQRQRRRQAFARRQRVATEPFRDTRQQVDNRGAGVGGESLPATQLLPERDRDNPLLSMCPNYSASA